MVKNSNKLTELKAYEGDRQGKALLDGFQLAAVNELA